MDWSVFWTAVGGIAQAAAAIATFLAAFVALWIGIREGRRSLQARYDDAHPVPIIASDPKSIPVHQGSTSELDWSKQPTLDVRNVGIGPAFNIKSVIYGPAAVAVPHAALASWSHRSNEKEHHWYHWTADAVKQANQKTLEYVFADPSISPNKFAQANKYIEPKTRFKWCSNRCDSSELASCENCHLHLNHA